MTRALPRGACVRVAAAVALMLLSVPIEAQDLPVVTLGVLVDGESERIMHLFELLKSETEA